MPAQATKPQSPKIRSHFISGRLEAEGALEYARQGLEMLKGVTGEMAKSQEGIEQAIRSATEAARALENIKFDQSALEEVQEAVREFAEALRAARAAGTRNLDDRFASNPKKEELETSQD